MTVTSSVTRSTPPRNTGCGWVWGVCARGRATPAKQEHARMTATRRMRDPSGAGVFMLRKIRHQALGIGIDNVAVAACMSYCPVPSAQCLAPTLFPVVSELQLDTEILRLEQANRRLQLVLRGRRDPQLIALDRGLDLLELLVLDVLHDVVRRFDRNPLLQRDRA